VYPQQNCFDISSLRKVSCQSLEKNCVSVWGRFVPLTSYKLGGQKKSEISGHPISLFFIDTKTQLSCIIASLAHDWENFNLLSYFCFCQGYHRLPLIGRDSEVQ